MCLTTLLEELLKWLLDKHCTTLPSKKNPNLFHKELTDFIEVSLLPSSVLKIGRLYLFSFLFFFVIYLAHALTVYTKNKNMGTWGFYLPTSYF